MSGLTQSDSVLENAIEKGRVLLQEMYKELDARLAGFGGVFKVFEQKDNVHALGCLSFFLEENTLCENRRPIDCLREGDVEVVLKTARDFTFGEEEDLSSNAARYYRDLNVMLSGLGDAFKILEQQKELSVKDILVFFTQKHFGCQDPSGEIHTPFEFLIQGKVAEVIRAANGHGEQVAW